MQKPSMMGTGDSQGISTVLSGDIITNPMVAAEGSAAARGHHSSRVHCCQRWAALVPGRQCMIPSWPKSIRAVVPIPNATKIYGSCCPCPKCINKIKYNWWWNIVSAINCYFQTLFVFEINVYLIKSCWHSTLLLPIHQINQGISYSYLFYIWNGCI